jgi:hypothetical protein
VRKPADRRAERASQLGVLDQILLITAMVAPADYRQLLCLNGVEPAHERFLRCVHRLCVSGPDLGSRREAAESLLQHHGDRIAPARLEPQPVVGRVRSNGQPEVVQQDRAPEHIRLQRVERRGVIDGEVGHLPQRIEVAFVMDGQMLEAARDLAREHAGAALEREIRSAEPLTRGSIRVIGTRR